MNRNNTTSNDTNSNLNITALTESARDYAQFSLVELGPDLAALLSQFCQNESESVETNNEVGQILVEQYCIKWNLTCFKQDGYLYVGPECDRNQGIIALDTSDLFESVWDNQKLIKYISIFSNISGYETGKNRTSWAESYPKTEDGRYQMVITLTYWATHQVELILTNESLTELELIKAKIELTEKIQPGQDKAHYVITEPTLTPAGLVKILQDMEWTDTKWTWGDTKTFC